MSTFWNQHYQNFDVSTASPFAVYCAQNLLLETDTVVELGCGNGRDALFIAPKVRSYVGLDSSSVAIKFLNEKNKLWGTVSRNKTKFMERDFTDQSFDEFIGEGDRLVIYSRFSYHSISYSAAAKLMMNFQRICVPFSVMMEVRTIYDELYGQGREVGNHEFVTDHYRRFIDPKMFLDELSQKFHVSYFETSKGFAPFEDSDPKVLRTMFQKKTSDNSDE
jgi:SAM-dependent methyltransferase